MKEFLISSFLVLVLIYLTLFLYKYEFFTDSFPITSDVRLYPNVGKFSDEHLIKSYGTNSLKACKRYCNLLESCEGISYRKDLDHKYKECRLYNAASGLDENSFYLSWKKYFSHMY